MTLLPLSFDIELMQIKLDELSEDIITMGINKNSKYDTSNPSTSNYVIITIVDIL
jgi:hypothetical protein